MPAFAGMTTASSAEASREAISKCHPLVTKDMPVITLASSDGKYRLSCRQNDTSRERIVDVLYQLVRQFRWHFRPGL